MRENQPTNALEGHQAMFDIDTLIAEVIASAPPITPKRRQELDAMNKRASATVACRQHDRAEHTKVLESVGGDREALKTITLWEPRKTTQQMWFRAFDRKRLFESGEAFHDEKYEVDTTEYDLIEVEVERARHPDEEVAFAKLQKRFIERKPSILGFFHKPSMKHGDRRQRKVLPAPLGDFEWCERDETITRENQLARSLASLRAARPIRNVTESHR